MTLEPPSVAAAIASATPGPLTRRERLEGGLLGLLVGDALGVPYEFHKADELPPREQLEMVPPAGFRRAHRRVPPGTWSDDGAQALCLLASLEHCDGLDPEDLARRFVNWLEWGYLAVDEDVFDVGIQTRRAIGALRHGVPALEAGPDGEKANGNGSLMRALPLALWHRGSDEELARDAHLQSRVTHGHMRSQVCCALYCLWARRLIENAPAPWTAAVASLRAIYRAGSDALEELEAHVRPDEPPAGKGSGYVLDYLNSARMVVAAHGEYEATVKAAIALGDDTDTTACVAGGIAGVMYGAGAIPPRWRDALRGRELYAPLLDALLARAE